MKFETVKKLVLVSAVLTVLWSCSKDESLVATTEQAPADAKVEAKPKGPAITGADSLAPHEKPQILADSTRPPLPIEETGNVARLPRSYPEHWVMVREVNFFNHLSGKVIVLDVAETKPQKRIKGMMDSSLLGNFGQSKTRGELYILESFHERGTRGPRTDVLVIYDKETLSIKKEIVWLQPNRIMALPERYSISLSKDEKFLFAANFSPAASFTVVDLDKQEIVTEIGTPGCVLTYPVGQRTVASLCSNGGMLSTTVNEDGTLKSQKRLKPFFDTDKTPIFEHGVFFNGQAFYPSFTGLLHGFDVSGEEVKYLGSSSLVSEDEQEKNWRPGGLFLNDVDDTGLMYTIFQPDGHEGTQTHGGTEVWVHDLKTKQRVRRIEVPNWAVSLVVTRGENPLLVVTNGEMNLDIFNANDGSFIHTVSDFGNVTPLALEKSY
ncbi:amine dehydrogenase large subunit [Dasania marina]|uniref:amine dehydrogenase large subunit n=1 Tax=Dasania marina TaxID=471499 RepID=UPI00037F4980|nr:amine dehydrogenase large subunit [Dasania marina]